jgi:prepilin-type N-terminal cleavage/methylation domain-containing protein
MMRRHAGFTLIELAIVMLVLTILAAGLLVPLTTNIESGRYAATQKILEEAREALIGFAMSNPTITPCTCDYAPSGALNSSGSTCPTKTPCPPSNPYAPNNAGTYTMIRHYLPCPDKTSAFGIATNPPNDGKEDRNVSGACEAQEGNFPWVDLGVGKADAWGNHLHYSVTDNATATFSDKSSGFTSASSGDKSICLSASCTTIIAELLPAVILSYGKNGRGAIHDDPLATSQVAPSSADERENTDIRTTKDPTCCKPALSGTNDYFVSRAPSEASATTTEFDDLVIWLPSSILVSRVCPSGGCP